MSGLDDIRRKRRRKGEPITLADLTASDRSPIGADRPTSAPSPTMRSSLHGDGAINCIAYLRHVVAQDGQRLALSAARRTPSGELAFTALTHAQLDERSDRLARGFAAAGWARGQRVMVLARPDEDSLAAVIALLKNGAVPVLIEPSRSRKDIAACVKLAGSPVLLTSSSGLLDRYLPGTPFGAVRTTVLLDSWLPMSVGRLTPLEKLEAADVSRLPLAATRPADPALVVFTNGATRATRPIILDHGTLIAQVELMRRARWFAEGENVLVSDLRQALLLLAAGLSVVLPRAAEGGRRASRRLMSCIDACGITSVIGSPTTWREVAETCARDGRQLPSVRQVLLTGGTVNLATHEAIQSALPAGEVRAIYGITESFAIAALTSGEMLGDTRELIERGAGLCLGQALPGVQAAIIDFGGAGRHADVGEVGEICIQGGAVAPTELLIHQDAQGLWLRTGDLGWRDRHGRLWLVARQGRVALTRFGPVYAVSCEQVFESHPAVRRAVVLGAGRQGEQECVLVIEPTPERWPKDEVAKVALQKELLEMGQSRGVTREIRRALFMKHVPVDRLALAQPRVADVLTFLKNSGSIA